MSVFIPFAAQRPVPEHACDIAALPYDVYSSDEAYEIAHDKPLSFLHVDKPEIDLEKGTDVYSDAVYKKARENLDKLREGGFLRRDESPCYYIYELTMDGRTQTGLCGCASVDDYINNVIKKHELTRADKERDRIRHVDACDANTGPIFLTYKDSDKINSIVGNVKSSAAPVYDFVSDNIRHRVWVISDNGICDEITSLFADVPALYIADGHHRAASAVAVGKMRREKDPSYTGKEDFNFFLAVAFPASELKILDYNRVVKDLNGLSKEEFIRKISEKFIVESALQIHPFKPSKPHEFGMYLENEWYRLEARPGTFDDNDPIGCLDVSILQGNLLTPVLGIGDPRTDPRIDFVGGIRGLKELEKRAHTDMKIAFSMYPTTVPQLMDIADHGLLMPPKSTWFEPKLLSGLFVHTL